MAVIHYRRDKNTPISCVELDETYDALREREQHTGVQPASTIYDLESTVEAYEFIQELLTCCDDLNTQLDSLREDLFGEGELSTIINNLRNQLLQDIAELEAQLADLETSLNASGLSLSGLAASITTLSQQIQGLQNSKANINSPTFTGTPKTSQPLASSNDDQIATTAFVKAFSVPIGVVLPYAGSSSPDDTFLLAQGQPISRVNYAVLFSLIGTTYGIGDGSTTFNLPNLTQRMPLGAGVGYDLGTAGGAATHTLSINEMPVHTPTGSLGAHTHTLNDPEHAHNFYAYTSGGQDNSDDFGHANTGIAGERDGNKGYINNNGSGTQIIATSTTGITVNPSAPNITLNSIGGGLPHNNLPPYTVLNFIIKAK